MADIQREWTKVGEPYPGLETNVTHWLSYKRESIPIIFVPGIMGSRLKRTSDDKTVWDPDDKPLMLWNYFTMGTPSHRKDLLVGNFFKGKYLTVDQSFPEETKNGVRQLLPHDDEEKHGWGGVSWGSYGTILTALAQEEWAPFSHIFTLPVYAMGYNWTNTNAVSGAALATRIGEVMALEKQKDRICNRVILVTHSMGGLVARAACSPKIGKKKDDVLGVVHGVQPVTGAGAAYWRMKAGFERPEKFSDVEGRGTAITLGATGKQVAAVLGNIPGGLELLPNAAYGPGWLEIRDEKGALVKQLPKADPYSEIYCEKTYGWRLVDGAALDPDGILDASPSSRWDLFVARVKAARQFHQTIHNYHHPKTFAFYGSGGSDTPTVDVVKFTLKPWGVLDTAGRIVHIVKSMLDPFGLIDPTGTEAVVFEELTSAAGRGSYEVYVKDAKGHVYRLELLDPDAAGDGTVPVRSGHYFEGLDEPIGRKVFSFSRQSPPRETFGAEPSGCAGMEHEPAYQHPAGIRFTISAIRELCAAHYKARRKG